MGMFIGCKKDNDNGTAALPWAVELSSYPLAIGNFWKYHTEMHIADSAGVYYDHHYFDNYWTVVSDTFINGVPSTKVAQLDSNYDGTTHLANTYYSNQPNGFYAMATDNVGSMLYLPVHQTEFNIGKNSYLQFPEFSERDTIFIPDSASWLLKFPSVLNDTWHAVRYGSGDFFQSRKYENYQYVNTGAGMYNCIKVKVYSESNGQPDTTSTVYQYFSSKGLIKETQFVYLTFGDGSTGTMTRTSELIQINF
jgi:hypothetical protein